MNFLIPPGLLIAVCYYAGCRANRQLYSACLGIREPPESLLFVQVLIYPALAILACTHTYAPDYIACGYAFNVILVVTMLGDVRRLVRRRDYAMLAHHALVLAASYCALRYRPLVFYSCMAGMAEVSSVFLNNVHLFRGRSVPSRVQTANGVLLWVSFIIFRLVLFPTGLVAFLRDREMDILPTFARSAVVTGMSGGFALSLWWFASITRGLLRHLRAP